MITATVIVKNGQRKLRDVLQALQGFNEVLIFDSGSTDQTLKIAKTFSNVSIYQRPFEGFGPAHNQAAELAKNDWILSIDADEVISEALAEEILNLKLDPKMSTPFHSTTTSMENGSSGVVGIQKSISGFTIANRRSFLKQWCMKESKAKE